MVDIHKLAAAHSEVSSSDLTFRKHTWLIKSTFLYFYYAPILYSGTCDIRVHSSRRKMLQDAAGPVQDYCNIMVSTQGSVEFHPEVENIPSTFEGLGGTRSK